MYYIYYSFKYERGTLQMKYITTAIVIINYCGFINSSQYVAYLNINKLPDIKKDDLNKGLWKYKHWNL